MSSNDDFFATKKAAAVFKHGILKRYPVVFASKTGRDVEDNRVVFLDGYAGRGEYNDGTPGSPLLLVQGAEYVEKYRNVLGFFVEQDDDNFANLTRVLEEHGGRSQHIARHGSLDEHLPEVLTMARDAALFAFLDPFGPALDFQVIKSQLLSRPLWPRTEVLLHFSVSSVARMGRAVHTRRATHGELRESDRKTAERLNRFLGGDWWQEHFAAVTADADERRATNVALDVAGIYSRMVADGTGYLSVSMPVRPRPDLLPKYVLVLFTRSTEGAWCFADSLGRAGRDWNGAWIAEKMGADTLFGDDRTVVFDPDRYERDHRERWIGQIVSNIRRLLENRTPFTLAERVTDVYGTTLGSAWDRHVRGAVKALHRDRVIANPGTDRAFYREVMRLAP